MNHKTYVTHFIEMNNDHSAHTKTLGTVRTCVLALITTIGSSLLSGCVALPPADMAYLGNPEPLATMILSGQVGPNEGLPLKGESSGTITPLCALAANSQPRALQAIDYLLAKGADVNKECGLIFQEKRPLDIAIAEAFDVTRKISPYENRTRDLSSHLQGHLNVAERLIINGAKAASGIASMEALQQELRQRHISWNAEVAGMKAEINRKNQQKSQENTQLFGALVTAAGTTVTAYSQSRNQASPPPSPPLNPVVVSVPRAQPIDSPTDTTPSTQSAKTQSSRKTHPFEDTRTYASEGIGTYTKASALESLQDQRRKLEGTFMGAHIAEWRVLRQAEPVCTQHTGVGNSNYGAKEYWRCTMKVTYAGLSWLNPNSPTPNASGVSR